MLSGFHLSVCQPCLQSPAVSCKPWCCWTQTLSRQSGNIWEICGRHRYASTDDQCWCTYAAMNGKKYCFHLIHTFWRFTISHTAHMDIELFIYNSINVFRRTLYRAVEQVALFDGQTSCLFWGKKSCPFQGTKKLTLLRNKQVAFFEGQTSCPFWGTKKLPFLRDKQVVPLGYW